MNIRILSWEHFNANVEWNPITSNLARRLAARYAGENSSINTR